MKKGLVLFGLLLALNMRPQQQFVFLDWKNPKPGSSVSIPFYSESDEYISYLGPFKSVVEDLAVELLHFDSFTFSIEFYKDCSGDSTYNRIITRRQADSAIAFMHRKTGNRLHLTAIGYGEDSLLNDCTCEIRNGEQKDGTFKPCNEEDHQKNRRMVVRIIGLRREN